MRASNSLVPTLIGKVKKLSGEEVVDIFPE